jgi:hypothetical protein
MAYADLALEYPRNRERPENCICTDIWYQRACSPNAEAELEVFRP